MTAHPIDDPAPDDPVEILRTLPDEYHAHFLAEYDTAIQQARCPEQFRLLHDLLRMWQLRALAYSSPGYADRLDAAREGTGFMPVTYRVEFGGGAQVQFHTPSRPRT